MKLGCVVKYFFLFVGIQVAIYIVFIILPLELRKRESFSVRPGRACNGRRSNTGVFYRRVRLFPGARVGRLLFQIERRTGLGEGELVFDLN